MISILWSLWVAIDHVLFVFVALTTCYMLVFAITSQFSHHSEVSKAKLHNRFIVLIPSYRQDKVVIQTVNSVLGQTYPQRMFDIVVVSDHQNEMTNMHLAQMPITLLTPNFEQSSKAKSMQYAILHLPQFKIYDAVVILDSGNIVEPEFLDQVNDAYTSAGTKAIQAHRMSKNRDTSAARLDAIFEEINNSVFRRGHIAVGLSAAISGSGMVFDFEWFKQNIMKIRQPLGEDKALESALLRDSIYIDYFDDIHVYDEKTRSTADFNDQRSRWASTQLHALINNIRFLPKALLSRNYDFVNKILEWALVPRTIMMGIIAVMCIVDPIIYSTIAVKWWVTAALFLFACSLATPDYLVDKHWDRDFLQAPVVLFWGIINIFRAGSKEAHDRIGSARWALHTKLPSIIRRQ